MDGVGRRPHLSFQAKVLIPVITVMVLLLATTMWVVNRRIAHQLENDADGRLRDAETAFKSFSEIRDNNLKLAYRNVANEPRLKAIARLNDPKTAQDNF